MATEATQTLITRPDFQLVSSRGFIEWLAASPLSLALTTYHVGGVLMLGSKPGAEASLHVAAFDRSMGISGDGQTIWLVTERMLWRLENDLADGQYDDRGYDRVFVPRVGYTTGEVDGHEVSIDGNGRPVFVNTRFSCLATIDERFSFRPLWRPPFISQLAPEDRCHLSGLAMDNGTGIFSGQPSESARVSSTDSRPRYVTMHARSDVADGWRDFRFSGGVVMDVETNEVVTDGLSMPHSPRVHAGRLWLLNSGTGHLGFIDPKGRQFEPVTFVPGYARGLAFHQGYAFVGLSKPRREHAFQGLPLEKNLAERGAAPRCGLQVIDLKTGAVLHWARIESSIEELFDVAVLPGVIRPRTLSFTSPTWARQLSFVHEGKLERWTVVPEHNVESNEHVQEGDRHDMMAPRRTPQNTAKALNNLGLSHAEHGSLDDARQCFEQAVSLDPNHAGAQNNLGNVLRQQDQLAQAIDCYRRALAADPNYPRAYFNLGQTLALLGRPIEAAASFARVLRVEPQNVEAGIALGMALKDQDKLDEAERCFLQVLELEPQSSAAYNGLGLVHKERGDLERALECYETAFRIDPQAAAALANQGLVLGEYGRMDEALACYDRALQIDPECVAAHHNRSMLRLKAGDFERGWTEYEWRWKQPRVRRPHTDAPLWDGSPLEGLTILLHAEQGKGDTIQFARYAAMIQERGGRVIVSAEPSMLPLLRMARGVDQLVSRDDSPPLHDVQAALLSLPACFGTTLESVPADVPYLAPSADLCERWKDELKDIGGFKVGIAWQGNPQYPGDKSRSIPLSQFAPLAALDGVTLFSLQQGFGVEQIESLAGEFLVLELGGRGNEKLDFPNTAALACQLDLVVTSDTSIAHLAGALAVPVWVALPLVADWRYLLDREDSPWYPSMRLFRQTTRGDWSTVFCRIAGHLAPLLP